MANLNEKDKYEQGIYQFEITDPLQGGENGVDNIPTRQLANRTRFLRNQFINYIKGYSYTPEARVASTANVNFLEGGSIEVDGVETEIDDVVLLKDQTDATQNGLYVVKSGTWERLNPYIDDTINIFEKKIVPVKEGETNAGKIFMVNRTEDYTLGRDTVEFIETLFSYTGGAGKIAIGNQNGEFPGLNADSLDDISALVDESKARNLLDVLGIRSVHSDEPATASEVAAAIAALKTRFAEKGFDGLRYCDYLDLSSLTVDGTTYTWNAEYKNLRLMIMGFNTYKSAGDTENTKNHIVMQFRNCVLSRRMNASNTNANGWQGSELHTWLNNQFKAGLIAALGNNLVTFRRLISNKGATISGATGWNWYDETVFLPSETEVWGTQVWGEKYYNGFQAQFPPFMFSVLYKVKKLNGSRMWWWEAQPHDGTTSSWCHCYSLGNAGSYSGATEAGGVAPAICVGVDADA